VFLLGNIILYTNVLPALSISKKVHSFYFKDAKQTKSKVARAPCKYKVQVVLEI